MPESHEHTPRQEHETHPADRGEYRGEPIPDSVRTETETGTARHRDVPIEVEHRPDQTQPTVAYERQAPPTYQPDERIGPDDNPSDPSAYDDPEKPAQHTHPQGSPMVQRQAESWGNADAGDDDLE